MKNKILLILILMVMGLAGGASAFTINVNGSLDEWGVQPDVYGSSQWSPNAGILSSVEDTSPAENTVGPGVGGQPFDVEAMYLTWDTTNVYFAVVTGFSPAGYGGYVPGDLAFDFGINGSYENGVSVLDRNSFSKGQLYTVSTWGTGLWTAVDPLSDPTYIVGGSEVIGGAGSLVYDNSAGYLGDHYVIEGYMPISAFGSDWGNDFRMHWAVSCGNDYLYVDYHNTTVPEPATLVLFGLGIVGLAFRKKCISA